MDIKKEVERAGKYVDRLSDKVNKVDSYLDEHIDQARGKISKLRALIDFIRGLFRSGKR